MLRLVIRAMFRAMILDMKHASCFIPFLLVASFALAQSEFSADMVDTQNSGTTTQAKIYMAKDKMRVESVVGNAKGSGGDHESGDSDLHDFVDKQHMYMEMSTPTAGQRTMYNFFHTGDVESACADWLQQPRNKGGSCHEVGNDTVNGRSTVKYEGASANDDAVTFWIDPKLRFPVKWGGNSGGGGSGELRNIQERTQPASLFEIPPGYTKFDMGGMKQPPR